MFAIFVNKSIIGILICLELNVSDVLMDVINVISSLAQVVWQDFT